MKKHNGTGVLKKFFLAHINVYMCLIIFFSIGMIIGGIQSALLGDVAKTDSYNYISTFLTAMKTKQIDVNILFREFLTVNFKPAIYIWLFGLWIIGVPLIYGYTAFEGYSLGFVISIIINSLGIGKGSLFLALALLPQEIILIPVLLTLGVNSVLFAEAVWQRKNRAINIKFDIYRYIFLFILSVVVLIGVTAMETYLQVPLIKFGINYIG